MKDPSMSESQPLEVVVVTGLSGAGRSTALRALEDLGYFCVDNLPPAAFGPALDEFKQGQLKRIALGIDVRLRSFLDSTISTIEQVRGDSSLRFTLLFLDASDAALLARFSGTRRPHPLRAMNPENAQSLAVVDGIALERKRLGPLRANASVTIDTTDLSVHDLRRRVLELFRGNKETGMLTRFLSFGFKYGSPADVDLMFDVRFIHNPYFIPELRPLSGQSDVVRDFVLPRATDFLRHTEPLLAYLVPQYEKEGKSYLTVAFGCTGGRHRSVALCEHLAGVLRRSGREITVEHRDIGRVKREAAEEKSAEAELQHSLPSTPEKEKVATTGGQQ